LKEFKINSLASIGWPDPCPDDSNQVKSDFLKNDSDLVYPIYKYVKNYSPTPIYIPSE